MSSQPITRNTLFYGDNLTILLLTIDELLHGATVQMPPQYGTFKQARRVREVNSAQPKLELI